MKSVWSLDVWGCDFEDKVEWVIGDGTHTGGKHCVNYKDIRGKDKGGSMTVRWHKKFKVRWLQL